MDRITGVSLTVGLGMALLVWLVFDLGVAAWHRYRARFDAQATVQAQSFFLSWDTRQLFAANLALMLGGSLLSGLWSGSIWIACATAGGLAYAPQWAYGLLRQRRLRRFEEQLPDALLMLSAGIRAGAGLSAAIGQTAQEAQAPLSQEFQLMLREQRLDQHERSKHLQHEGRGQLTEAGQQRTLPDIAKVGTVLAVPLQIDRVAGKGVHPRVEGGQRRQRAEHEVAIVDHAVRMARWLAIEFLVGLGLEAGTQIIAGIAVRDRGERGHRGQRQQHEQGQPRHPAALHQTPFVPRDQPGRTHAAAASP